jgi:hypothetical protein
VAFLAGAYLTLPRENSNDAEIGLPIRRLGHRCLYHVARFGTVSKYRDRPGRTAPAKRKDIAACGHAVAGIRGDTRTNIHPSARSSRDRIRTAFAGERAHRGFESRADIDQPAGFGPAAGFACERLGG